MATLKETLPKEILNLFLFSVHVAPNFVIAVNCFSPPLNQKLISSLISVFSLFCGILVQMVKSYY